MQFSDILLRMIIGSVSDYIVRNCKCPVFVIKDGDERRPSEPKPQATTSDAPNSGAAPLASAA